MATSRMILYYVTRDRFSFKEICSI